MTELFSAKVRSVGTSLGILIPIEIIKEAKIKEGESIEVNILKRNKKFIKESFGIDRGTSKFERDHRDRNVT